MTTFVTNHDKICIVRISLFIVMGRLHSSELELKPTSLTNPCHRRLLPLPGYESDSEPQCRQSFIEDADSQSRFFCALSYRMVSALWAQACCLYAHIYIT